MSKILVAYFSASGVTGKAAEKLARLCNGDLYEIRPETAYCKQDLDWRDPRSRSSIEMKDPDCRPALADKDADVAGAEVIYLGFPIWWYREPSIIDSFLDAYDFSGKTIIPFATSGGSGLGDTAKRLQELKKEAVVKDGARLNAISSEEELKEFIRNNS